MSFFEGKKLIIIGDRDGIPGPAIEECVKGKVKKKEKKITKMIMTKMIDLNR